jgi:hypothetical protein
MNTYDMCHSFWGPSREIDLAEFGCFIPADLLDDLK